MRHPRWTFHFTTDLVLMAQCRRGLLRQADAPAAQERRFPFRRRSPGCHHRFVREYNAADPKPFIWKANPDDIIAARNRGFQTLESIH
jgi:hypothetical protein